MLYLKADTITEVTIGPAVAVGDGFTPVIGLVGSSADEFEIIKHGATTATTIAGTLAAITGADGYYSLDLSATDTNTEGRLVLLINDDSLILPIRHEFMVINANVYDSLFAAAGTDLLQTDLTQVVGSTTNVAALATNVDAILTDTADIQPNYATSTALATVDTVVDGIQTDLSNGTDGLGAIKNETALILADTADIQPNYATSANLAIVDTEVGAMQADVTALIATVGTAGDGLTAIDLPDQTMNITGNLSGSVGSVTGAVGSVTAEVSADTVKIGGVAAAAAQLALSTQTIVSGTVDNTAFTATATVLESDDITTAAADHYIGRVIIFTSGTLQNQATDITDYSLTGGRGRFTYTTLTSAPADNDTFIIV